MKERENIWHSYGEDDLPRKPDQLVYNFNASIDFDRKFYRQDIRGSIAHVKMLAKQGILTEEEGRQIVQGLEGILQDVESGSWRLRRNMKIFTALWRRF